MEKLVINRAIKAHLNIIKKTFGDYMKLMSVRELKSHIGERNITIIDIRNREEFLKGHINGAIHMDANDVMRNARSLPHRQKIVFVCERGNTSIRVATMMSNLGYECYSLVGGYRAFIAAQS